jgi:hypothetical protein
MSIGMRNELRAPEDNATLNSNSYNWPTWYTNMVAAAKIINAANPDILIFFSGLNFDTTLSPVVAGTGSGITFKKSDFTFSNKIVLELHNYQNSATSCSNMQSSLQSSGFSTLTAAAANQYPMLLTEWGHDWSNSDYLGVYASCLHSYLPAQHVGWTIWVLAGSYYIRSGTQDYEETWGMYRSSNSCGISSDSRTGLYNHNWTAWRNAAAIDNLKLMVKATLA